MCLCLTRGWVRQPLLYSLEVAFFKSEKFLHEFRKLRTSTDKAGCLSKACLRIMNYLCIEKKKSGCLVGFR
jgi:hypothetical protein